MISIKTMVKIWVAWVPAIGIVMIQVMNPNEKTYERQITKSNYIKQKRGGMAGICVLMPDNPKGIALEKINNVKIKAG